MPNGGEWVNMEIDRQTTGQSIWNLVQIFTLMAISHCFICHSIATRFETIQKKANEWNDPSCLFSTVANQLHRSPLIRFEIHTWSEKSNYFTLSAKTERIAIGTFVHKIKWINANCEGRMRKIEIFGDGFTITCAHILAPNRLQHKLVWSASPKQILGWMQKRRRKNEGKEVNWNFQRGPFCCSQSVDTQANAINTESKSNTRRTNALHFSLFFSFIFLRSIYRPIYDVWKFQCVRSFHWLYAHLQWI